MTFPGEKNRMSHALIAEDDAAASESLAALIASGGFVFQPEIASLRRRGGNDALAVREFLGKTNQASGTRTRFAPGSLGLTRQHPGPESSGNPRPNLHRVFNHGG
jgi:hypothetical protein